MEIGKAIRSLRKELRIKQVTLANASGFSKTYISQIETGDRNPSYKAIEIIAKAMGISMLKMTLYAFKEDVPENEELIHDMLNTITNYL